MGIHLDDGQIGVALLQRQDSAKRNGMFAAQQEGKRRVQGADAIPDGVDQLLRRTPGDIEVAEIGVRHVVKVAPQHRAVGFDAL